jgi:hypothetical protein
VRGPLRWAQNRGGAPSPGLRSLSSGRPLRAGPVGNPTSPRARSRMFPTSVTYIAELGNTRVRWGEVKMNPFSRRMRARVMNATRKIVPRSRIASRLRRRWNRLSARSCPTNKRKRNAGRRISPNLRALRARLARSVARSPVGVPPRHLRQRANATAQLQNALPGTRLRSGRYPPPPVPVQRLSRRPVIMPAGRLPEAARVRR